jgi:hypothetical protein
MPRPRIDAEQRAAVDLGRRVAARQRPADQAEFFRFLQFHNVAVEDGADLRARAIRRSVRPSG